MARRGFLAAYNGGPGRLDDYLTRNRALPEETRRYVAKIGPYITDSAPNRRSTAETYAMNALPTSIPAGPRYSAPPFGYAAAPATPAALCYGRGRVRADRCLRRGVRSAARVDTEEHAARRRRRLCAAAFRLTTRPYRGGGR